MKERPILFSGEMVRALLNGSKTQTRRIVKPTQSAPRVPPLRMEPWIIDGEWQTDDDNLPCWAGFHPDYPGEAKWFSCPYGASGDRLWVRETWNTQTIDGVERVAYRADIPNGYSFIGWRPSIFMPRALSRITLEITGVRVERVQDISHSDACAEGVAVTGLDFAFAQLRFAELWDKINADRAPWDSNPWVWVVEFRRV